MQETDKNTSVRTAALWLRLFILGLLAATFSALEAVVPGCSVAALACALLALCDITLGNLKHGGAAMREGRFVFWTLLKQAMRFWSV